MQFARLYRMNIAGRGRCSRIVVVVAVLQRAIAASFRAISVKKLVSV
jgi:hypothetical protein